MVVKVLLLLFNFMLLFLHGQSATLGRSTANTEQDLADLRQSREKRFHYFKSRLITISGPTWSKRSQNNQNSKNIDDEDLPVSIDLIKDETLNFPDKFLNMTKRGKKTRGTIKLLLVTDFRIFLSFLTKYESVSEAKAHLKEYYEHFIGYLSEIFERAAHSFSITIKPAAIVMAMDMDSSKWAQDRIIYSPTRGENLLKAKSALKVFGQWVLRHKSKLPQFDHAIAVTNIGLYEHTEMEGLRGLAWTGGMCSRRKGHVDSSSIITDRGAFQGVLTAAHELGHSLGAPHDGSHRCPETDRFLMSPSLPRSVDIARFSPCSEYAIEHRFRTNKYPCLLDHLAIHSHSKVSLSRHPGSRYDADELCTEWFGERYHACHLLATTDLYQPMCSGMLLCGLKKNHMVCDKQDVAPTGTPCGQKRVCRDHRCVSDSRGPCCPLKHEDHDYCARKIHESDENCQNPNMKFLCCRHCGITC